MFKINIQKAKEIAHNIRRDKRSKEFKPYDEIIARQIPGNNNEDLELQREKIRQKYSLIQSQIDNSTTLEEITQILDSI
jgi:hypothetical protein